MMLVQSIIISCRGVAKHAQMFEDGRCLVENTHVKEIEKMVESVIGLVEQVEVDIVVDFPNFIRQVRVSMIIIRLSTVKMTSLVQFLQNFESRIFMFVFMTF